jgi:hypothetical protein
MGLHGLLQGQLYLFTYYKRTSKSFLSRDLFLNACGYQVVIHKGRPKCNFSACFVFHTADLTENNQAYYEIYSCYLPIFTVSTAFKSMCRYCGRISLRHSQFFNYRNKLDLINLSVFLKAKFLLFYVVMFTMKALVYGRCLSPKFLSSVFYANLGLCLNTVVPGIDLFLCVCVCVCVSRKSLFFSLEV